MRSRCCLCVPPIVATQRLGKNPPIIARQRIGKNPPIIARQRIGKNPPIIARQRLGSEKIPLSLLGNGSIETTHHCKATDR
jgi:hypothetical protein